MRGCGSLGAVVVRNRQNGGVSVRVDVKAGIAALGTRTRPISVEDLLQRFPKLREWEAGEAKPTFKQFDSTPARRSAVRILLPPEPPVEEMPIPDFGRWAAGISRVRARICSTRSICASSARSGTASMHKCTGGAASFRRLLPRRRRTSGGSDDADALHFDLEERSELDRRAPPPYRAAEDLGVLVMVNGVVGNNTHRKLDSHEFRGFALADPLAPLVFVNGADTKAAQMFTLAHELAHIWLGIGALRFGPFFRVPQAVERGAIEWRPSCSCRSRCSERTYRRAALRASSIAWRGVQGQHARRPAPDPRRRVPHAGAREGLRGG